MESLAVNLNTIFSGYPLTDMRRLSINGDSTRTNPVLHFPARAVTEFCQHLLQFLGFLVGHGAKIASFKDKKDRRR